MANDAVIRYKPLGWSVWVYGPIFALMGAFLLYQWQAEIFHTVASSGIVVRSTSDWFSAVICPGSRCDTLEYALSAVMWVLFFCSGLVFLFLGMLMMNIDRSTIVENRTLLTWRGNFVRWQKQSLTSADIEKIDVAMVPVFGLIGKRAYKIGDKWRVTAILKAKGMMGKPKKRILAIEWKEADARAIAARCMV